MIGSDLQSDALEKRDNTIINTSNIPNWEDTLKSQPVLDENDRAVIHDLLVKS